MKALGLIAGSGQFPLLVAAEAKKQGTPVVALGLNGITDKNLESLVGQVRYFKLGELEKPIRAFKAAGVERVVMAGKVQHISLFGGVLPDWRALKLLARLKDKKTDTILKAVAEEFSKDGLELISSAAYLSHLLAAKGLLTRRRPNAKELADIELGWKAAKLLAGLDVGQTAVVQEGAVVALEAMEGTDACVRRAWELSSSHGKNPALVVVKVAKPRQDLRFDLPVVGLESLKVFASCGVKVLAVEAGSTLIFDGEDFLVEANRQKLAVLGIEN